MWQLAALEVPAQIKGMSICLIYARTENYSISRHLLVVSLRRSFRRGARPDEACVGSGAFSRA